MYLGSQAPLYQNVRIRCIDKNTGKCRVERTAKNRVTRLMLWGISKFLAGEFNDSTPDMIYEYIPRYLAFGTNVPGSDSASSGVTTLVTVNDTRLLNEITSSSSTGETTSVKRISIQSRQHMKTSTRFSDPFVKLSLTMYVSSHQFDNMEIGEAGLFSKERDNNCVARVVFSPFRKGEDEVIEVCWDITLLSYGTTKYPDNITINEAKKVIIPLYYSPYYIKSTHLKLIYIPETPTQGYFRFSNDISEEPVPIATVNDGRIVFDDSRLTVDNITGKITIINEETDTAISAWKNYLEENNILFDNVVRQLALYGTKSGDNVIFKSSDTLCSMYLSEAERVIDNVTLLADNEGALLQDSEFNFIAVEGEASVVTSGKGLYVSRIYKEETSYEKEVTDYIISNELDKIIEKNNNYTAYTIHNRQIYKIEGDIETETSGYIQDGYIMDGDTPTGYMYNAVTGEIYKLVETTTEGSITSAFVVPQANKYKICQTTSYENVTNYTKYWIDWNNHKSVYSEDGDDTEYHVTNDMYFATGDTHKFPYTITPTDATDKTVSWSSLNDNVSLVSQFGIATGWNVGETYITVTTSNGIKARTIVEVVKNLEVVATKGIELTPSTVTFDANITDPQKTIITAVVHPASATYNVVSWSMDANAEALFSFAELENNRVQVAVKAVGGIGRGYITATTADGVSAKCLLQSLSEQETEDDCPSEDHDDQHSH